MHSLVKGLFIFIVLIIHTAMAQHLPSFVQARGTTLQRDSKPYHISGANYWQAMNLGMASTASSSGNRSRVHKDLRKLQSCGVNVIRILASSEGSSTKPPDRIHPVLMESPGVYNSSVFEGLDWVLAQLPKYNMTAIVTLSNYWTWSGGIAQYVSWATGEPIPYPEQWNSEKQRNEGGEYSAFLEYANRFYDDDRIYDTVQAWYRANVRAVVGRVNTVTGTAYSRDENILAWELMNEPQIISAKRGGMARLERWIEDSARLVSELAPDHLVTSGAESKNGREWFMAMHRPQHITLASAHFWAQNWGYYDPSIPTNGSLDGAVEEMRVFVGSVATWSAELNKPCGVFEFGLARDSWGEFSGLRGYDPRAPVTHKVQFYKAMFDAVSGYVGEGTLVGAAFWAYAGTARPPQGPTDEMTWVGDPPHEPPGWYSVYDKDESTLRTIKDFSRSIGAY